MQLKLIKTARMSDDIPFVKMGDGPVRRELDICDVVGFDCDDGNFDIVNNEENRRILKLVMRGESVQTEKLIRRFKAIGLWTERTIEDKGNGNVFVLKVYKDEDLIADIFECYGGCDFILHDGIAKQSKDVMEKVVEIIYEMVIGG